ncbi:MFS transporter [Paraburkholderia sp. BCC1886]|uniref:MFS transporter n=1 Tax=Paraburkholderia sp. BCC1886 TaxID=2562670 RepID=UPI001182EBFB|nr:MFS transporter [Paraburkholderia sp. BCC1886]
MELDRELAAPGERLVVDPASQDRNRSRFVVAAVIGNWLEAFDFTVFGFFSIFIGRVYFPAADSTTSLLLAVATFAVGFLARPVGSVVLGIYADLAGRRAALSLTLLLMAAGTLAVGLTPAYGTIGLAAPVIVVMGRLVQGFAQGGEFGAATAMLVEGGVAGRRGFRASWQLASQGGAAIMGAGVAQLLTALLSNEAMLSWGWRMPFLAGALIAPIGIYLRNALPERGESQHAHRAERGVLRMLLTQHGKTLLLVTLMVMGGTVSNYILLFYMPTYVIHTLGLPASTSFSTGVAAGLVTLVAAPVFGAWSDRKGNRKRPMFIGRGILIVLLYPCFLVTSRFPSMPVILTMLCVMVLFYTMGSAPQFSLMSEAFPPRLRATGISIAYTASATLFGGTAQLVVTWLLKSTGNPAAPAAYVALCLLISVLATSRLKVQVRGGLEEAD